MNVPRIDGRGLGPYHNVRADVKKLPASWHKYALPVCTTFFMTFLVSGVATWRALGFNAQMVRDWMSSWMISWVIAAPTMYFVMPVVRRLLDRATEK